MGLRNRDMLRGPLLKNIVLFAVPIMLTGVLQLLFNAADMVIVGQYCGSLSLAAVGATSYLTALFVNLFIGFSIGAGVCVARAIGSGDPQNTHRTVHTAIPVALVSGAILTVVGILFSEPMLVLLGTPENVLPLSVQYMQIYFAGIMFSMLYNFGASILRAAGDSQSPLIFLTIAGVLNVALNVLFVTVLDMNVAGVALATTISQALSAILVLMALMRRTDNSRLHLPAIRFYRRQFWDIIRIGLPAGLQSSLFAISNVMIQSSVNSFGEVFMSGNAAAGNIDGFVHVILDSFSQTAMNFVGQNYGAKQFDRVKRIAIICAGCVIVVGIAVGQLVYALGPQLLSLYITDSALAIQHGMTRLAYVSVPYFICALMGLSTSLLRGMGYSTVGMILSVLGGCGLRILWILTVFQIPKYHTPGGLLISYTVTWSTTFVVLFTAFWILLAKQRRLHELQVRQ